MAPFEWLRVHPIAGAALAGVALAVLIAVLRPIPGADSGPTPTPGWRLPDLSALAASDADRFVRIRRSEVWGAAASAAPRAGRGGAVARSGWRLLGVIAEPTPRALILNEPDGQVLRLAVDQNLPDGGRLVDIGDTLIRFERDGCRFERRLFAPGAETPGECPDLDAVPESDPISSKSD